LLYAPVSVTVRRSYILIDWELTVHALYLEVPVAESGHAAPPKQGRVLQTSVGV